MISKKISDSEKRESNSTFYEVSNASIQGLDGRRSSQPRVVIYNCDIQVGLKRQGYPQTFE